MNQLARNILGANLKDNDLDRVYKFLKEGKDELLPTIPSLAEIVQEVRKNITSGFRFCIVGGLRFECFDNIQMRNRYILAISNILGVPTKTDQVLGEVIWDVKVDPNPNVKNTTYSQHNHYADLHTDTQYFRQPEEVISLWCLSPDRFGGGESLIADGRELINILNSSPTGIADLNILKTTQFPFRVPSVFTMDGNDKCFEVFTAPIISERPLIRYRRETIEKARIKGAYKLDDRAVRALDNVDVILANMDMSHKFLLNTGQVVFINNHELLHGRTAFTDINRHLLRVRLNLK